MKAIASFIAYSLFIYTILYLGWNEPLRYRFLSREEIVRIERARADALAPPKTPTPSPTPRPTAPPPVTPKPIKTGHTALDRDRPY